MMERLENVMHTQFGGREYWLVSSPQHNNSAVTIGAQSNYNNYSPWKMDYYTPTPCVYRPERVWSMPST